jgi:hypothetical protein
LDEGIGGDVHRAYAHTADGLQEEGYGYGPGETAEQVADAAHPETQ